MKLPRIAGAAGAVVVAAALTLTVARCGYPAATGRAVSTPRAVGLLAAANCDMMMDRMHGEFAKAARQLRSATPAQAQGILLQRVRPILDFRQTQCANAYSRLENYLRMVDDDRFVGDALDVLSVHIDRLEAARAELDRTVAAARGGSDLRLPVAALDAAMR